MKFFILDRVAVMNEDSPSLIRRADERRPLPASINAIARLCNPGFEIVVAMSGLAGVAEAQPHEG